MRQPLHHCRTSQLVHIYLLIASEIRSWTDLGTLEALRYVVSGRQTTAPRPSMSSRPRRNAAGEIRKQPTYR